MSTVTELKDELRQHFNCLTQKINDAYDLKVNRIQQQQKHALLTLEKQFNDNMNYLDTLQQMEISKTIKIESNQYGECYKIKCNFCINQFQCISHLHQHMKKFHNIQDTNDKREKHEIEEEDSESYINCVCDTLNLVKKIDINVYGFSNHTEIYSFIYKMIQIKSDVDRNDIIDGLTQNKLRDIKSKIYSDGLIGKKKQLAMGVKNELMNIRNNLYGLVEFENPKTS